MTADVTKQEIRFTVGDMSKFDEGQLKAAFKKKEFDTIEVLGKQKT